MIPGASLTSWLLIIVAFLIVSDTVARQHATFVIAICHLLCRIIAVLRSKLTFCVHVLCENPSCNRRAPACHCTPRPLEVNGRTHDMTPNGDLRIDELKLILNIWHSILARAFQALTFAIKKPFNCWPFNHP